VQQSATIQENERMALFAEVFHYKLRDGSKKAGTGSRNGRILSTIETLGEPIR
jgi:hypothetical protein